MGFIRRYEGDDCRGICLTCKERITHEEWENQTHPCKGAIMDGSWAAVVNPHNEEWKPGYRFNVAQDSQTTKGGNVHRNTRVYNIVFEVDEYGNANPCPTSPTKPTEATLKRVKELAERNMPKLFLSRSELEHIVDSWAMANDPTSAEIAAKAKALLEKLP